VIYNSSSITVVKWSEYDGLDITEMRETGNMYRIW
jgi:hypothetical protein